MPAINFSVFIEQVENGSKKQTIRKRRKRPIKVGDTLQLYTGMRTPACRKLGVTTCTGVEPLVLHCQGVEYTALKLMITRFAQNSLNDFAKQDGFKSWPQLASWFHLERKPFEGDLIRWELLHE